MEFLTLGHPRPQIDMKLTDRRDFRDEALRVSIWEATRKCMAPRPESEDQSQGIDSDMLSNVLQLDRSWGGQNDKSGTWFSADFRPVGAVGPWRSGVASVGKIVQVLSKVCPGDQF